MFACSFIYLFVYLFICLLINSLLGLPLTVIDQDILYKLRLFNPVIISNDDTRYLTELAAVIKAELKANLAEKQENEDDSVTDIMMRKCSANFLYVSVFVREHFTGTKIWSGPSIEAELAIDISSFYLMSFENIWIQGPQFYESFCKPLLAILVVMREPLPLLDASRILKFTPDVLKRAGLLIMSFFPLRMQGLQQQTICFHFYHRSVLEWLVDPSRSQKFYIDPASGHALFAKGLLEQICRESHYSLWKFPGTCIHTA